jgi:hypothetical protein
MFPGLAPVAAIRRRRPRRRRRHEGDRHHVAFGRVGHRVDREPRLRRPEFADVDVGDGQGPVGEREPPARGQHAAGGGDRHAAVVDGAARLVAHEVGVDVPGREGPRAFLHQPATDLVLAEGEVARRRIEDQIDATGRQGGARAVGHPGVFTDLEADA